MGYWKNPNLKEFYTSFFNFTIKKYPFTDAENRQRPIGSWLLPTTSWRKNDCQAFLVGNKNYWRASIGNTYFWRHPWRRYFILWGFTSRLFCTVDNKCQRNFQRKKKLRVTSTYDDVRSFRPSVKDFLRPDCEYSYSKLSLLSYSL